MGLFDFLFGKSDYDKVKSEREKNDRNELMAKIADRQAEASMFGGEWDFSGAIFPAKEKEAEYYRYLSKKRWGEIKEKNPELYAAMQRINDGYPLVLDTEKKTFCSEGWEE